MKKRELVLLSSAHWQNKGQWSLKNITFHLNRRKHAFTVEVAEQVVKRD